MNSKESMLAAIDDRPLDRIVLVAKPDQADSQNWDTECEHDPKINA